MCPQILQYPFVSLLAHTNKDLQTKLRDMIVTDVSAFIAQRCAVLCCFAV